MRNHILRHECSTVPGFFLLPTEHGKRELSKQSFACLVEQRRKHRPQLPCFTSSFSTAIKPATPRADAEAVPESTCGWPKHRRKVNELR